MAMMNLLERRLTDMVPQREIKELNVGGRIKKKSCTTWWINSFKDLVDRGVFLPGNVYHNECIWFCFKELVQHDLDFVVLHWNTHYMRQSRHNTVPGRPDELFFLPERSEGVITYSTPHSNN